MLCSYSFRTHLGQTTHPSLSEPEPKRAFLAVDLPFSSSVFVKLGRSWVRLASCSREFLLYQIYVCGRACLGQFSSLSDLYLLMMQLELLLCLKLVCLS